MLTREYAVNKFPMQFLKIHPVAVVQLCTIRHVCCMDRVRLVRNHFRLPVQASVKFCAVDYLLLDTERGVTYDALVVLPHVSSSSDDPR